MLYLTDPGHRRLILSGPGFAFLGLLMTGLGHTGVKALDTWPDPLGHLHRMLSKGSHLCLNDWTISFIESLIIILSAGRKPRSFIALDSLKTGFDFLIMFIS